MRIDVLKKYSLLYCLFCLLAIGSCNTTQESDLPKEETEVPVVTGPKRVKVYIKQMKYQPAVIEVNKGDVIVFINKDIVVHDVTEEATKAWTSGPIQINDTWTMVAKESVNFYCSIHVVMKGKIIVK
ncbi:MAG TPA: plastocyanin/azurin family copper-binding protein [Fulvivirga sp.]|nr:plastocyanin/azurin family copper-binding protein [Fulvivirga sp.]